MEKPHRRGRGERRGRREELIWSQLAEKNLCEKQDFRELRASSAGVRRRQDFNAPCAKDEHTESKRRAGFEPSQSCESVLRVSPIGAKNGPRNV
jgi:hypothetical protein